MTRTNPITFRTILDYWPTAIALAEDLGIAPHLIRKWRERDRIPQEYLFGVYQAALYRGFPVSAERLLMLAAGRIPPLQDHRDTPENRS